MKSAELVARCGTMWPGNEENIRRVRKVAGDGIYILLDGSMPMYIGQGQLGRRIKKAADSDSRGQRWNCFSWYEIKKAKYLHDIDVLVLRMFPANLRPLTRQDGHFIRKNPRVEPDEENLHAVLSVERFENERRKSKTRD